MSDATTLSLGVSERIRDLIALTKPRITLMVLITAAGGMWLAAAGTAGDASAGSGLLGGPISPWAIAIMLLTTTAVVAAANSLNCWLERDTDRLMRRTMKRPLPDGRMRPRVALVFGVVLGLISVPVLTVAINPVTGALGALALASYVLVYTPMKQKSPAALLVGALPGALPPLMGWTAVTGRMDVPGLALFGILFFWQIPHFIAIAIYRRSEYERAGIQTLPTVRGEHYAKLQAVFYSGLLLACSILPFVYRVAGTVYLVTALVLGGGFFGMAVRGLWVDSDEASTHRWARQLFVVSLLYLTVLFAVLMVDAR